MAAPATPVDTALARRQLAEYVQVLRSMVPRVIELPAEEALPDCVFVEDTAVVTPSGVAVISRPGAPERQGEVAAVEAALAALMAEGGERPLVRSLHRIQPPGLLDGGDVLQLAGLVFVGLSSRTNAEGAAQLRAALVAAGDASPVVELPVRHGLHLKSACSALDDETLLLSDNAAGHAVDAALRSARPSLAGRLRRVYLPDALAANVVRAGRAVAAQGTPAAIRALHALCDARGLELREVPRMTEFEKANGALTCCSILLS